MQTSWLQNMFYRSGLIDDWTAEIRIFDLFAHVTLTWTRWPSYRSRTWPVFLGDIADICKWYSYVNAFESYLQPAIIPCECVHLVTRGHFWSRDQDGGDTIVENDENRMHAHLVSPSLIEPGLWAIEVLQCGNKNFRLFAPVTLTLTRWPSHMNLTRIAWRYTGCANMNLLRQGIRKLSSDRQTDTTEINIHVGLPRRFAGGQIRKFEH